MEKTKLKIGDIVQINSNHRWKGCLVIVTEPKSWGAQGYILTPWDCNTMVYYKEKAYVRMKFEDFELVGKLAWHDIADVGGDDE